MKPVANTEEFIARAHEAHGDTYGYEETHYRGSSNKVAIRCKAHGVFWQIPRSHLIGHGCARCSAIQRMKDRKAQGKPVGRAPATPQPPPEKTVADGVVDSFLLSRF